jgi:lipoprotein-anchoring transpeptidase ErfK/SrfK
MVGGESDAAMYDLAGVPWNTYITENGVAMHGTFWHNDYGIPHSHGCINMKPQDARRIYRWTLPSVPDGERFLYQPGQGTSVQVVRAGSNMSRRPK